MEPFLWGKWWCSLFLITTGNTFLGKVGPKNQNCHFELKFCTRLIWICSIMKKIWGASHKGMEPFLWGKWWCSLFLISTGNTFLGKVGPKNQDCQFELKFCTSLIWICRIIKKICGVHFFCFRPEKPFLTNLVQKIAIVSFSWKSVLKH